MRKNHGTTTVAAAAFILVTLGLGVVVYTPRPSPPAAGVEDQLPHLQAQQVLAESPITFEQNLGQADPRAQYLSRVNGATVFLTPDSMVVRMPGRRTPQTLSPLQKARLEPEPDLPPATLRMNLVGSNSDAAASGVDELPQKTHYQRGNDPAKWRRNVPHFAKVRYDEVYPGIDLVYYSRERQIEYDFIVAPGADPSLIRFALDGVNNTRIDHEGNLIATTPRGEVKQAKPYIYQEASSAKSKIDGSFRRGAGDTFTFELASYNPRLPLVIDPMVDVALTFGGSGTDRNFAIAVDAHDNFIVGGHTDSVSFLDGETNGDFDGFITVLRMVPPSALTPEGAEGGAAPEVTNYIIGETFIIGGDADDSIQAIAFHPDGVILAGGTSASSDLPVTGGDFQKGVGPTVGFVATFPQDAQGNLQEGMICILDPLTSGVAQEIALTPFDSGFTQDRTLFCTTDTPPAGLANAGEYGGGPSDIALGCFPVDKLTGHINLEEIRWQYFGRDGIDAPSALTFDGSSVFLTGGSQNAVGEFEPLLGSVTLPFNVDSFFDVNFEIEVNSAIWDLPSGSQGFPFGIFCKHDYVYLGITSDAPSLQDERGTVVENPGNFSIFEGLWSKDFERLHHLYVHGGSQNENGAGMFRGLDWVYYICGETNSNNFPQVNSIQPQKSNGSDLFAIKCWIDIKEGTPNPQTLYSTYYGGVNNDRAFKGAVDSWGNLVMVGWSGSSFPTLFGPSYGGGESDGFLVRFKMPHVPLNGIVAPGSFRPGPISPGKIISVFGHWVGTKVEPGVGFTYDEEGRFPKKLAETECIFVDGDGQEHPGAMLFSSHRQTNCVVPYSLPEGDAWFYLVNKGIKSNPVDLVVQKTCPDLLNLGGGQAAVVNLENGTINGPNTPASPGSFVSIYMTGGGCPRDQIEVCDPVPTMPGVFYELALSDEVVVTVGDTAVAGLTPAKASAPGEAGASAAVIFAGLAPGFTPGLVQINAQLGEDCPTGQVPLTVSIGGVETATGMFMYVAE